MDTVVGIPGSRSHIVMLRPPEGGLGLELSSFIWPEHEPGSPAAMANELAPRNVSFEVDDLQGNGRLAADGYGLVGDIGQYENIWRQANVRGPSAVSIELGLHRELVERLEARLAELPARQRGTVAGDPAEVLVVGSLHDLLDGSVRDAVPRGVLGG